MCETEVEREEPFWDINDHRSVIRDIQLMQENLRELEKLVRRLEWIELGGRGGVDPDQVDKLTDAVEGSMPYIRDDIRELNPLSDGDRDE